MKNNDTNKNLTPAERMAMEAEAAALFTKRKKLLAFLKADEAAKKDATAEVTEVPKKEEDVTAEVTEVPEKEEEATVEVVETPEKEEKVTVEVAETPEKEEETTAETVITEVTEDSVDEENSDEPFDLDGILGDWNKKEELPDSEKSDVPTLVIQTPEKENENASTRNATAKNENKKVKKNTKSKDFNILKPILVAFAIVLLAAILICTIVPAFRKEDSSDANQQPSTNQPVDTQPSVDAPDNTVDQKFNMAEFKQSVVKIAAQLTEEDINANTDIFVENIGEDKLVELIKKHGELNVQKAIAEMLSFVPEVKTMQYVANNELNYNPNASEDYDSKLQELKSAYVAATGKNPDGVLMSLEGYEINKSNRAAMESLILETGDTALLEWYKAKSEAFDTMMNQNRDNQTAEAYKNEVKLELVNSKGTIDLLTLQLEKEVSGQLNVMDNVSMKYTEAYKQFVLNNYIYVIAK